MKKLLLSLVFALLITNGAAAASSGYTVTVKTGIVHFTDVEPISIENITYIPLRAVFEKLGCVVTWVADTRTVFIRKDNTLLQYPTSGNKFFINGEERTFNGKDLITNGRVLVPVDFFITLGMEVSEDGASIALFCKSCSQ